MGPSVSIKYGSNIIIAKINVCSVIIINPPVGGGDWTEREEADTGNRIQLGPWRMQEIIILPPVTNWVKSMPHSLLSFDSFWTEGVNGY